MFFHSSAHRGGWCWPTIPTPVPVLETSWPTSGLRPRLRHLWAEWPRPGHYGPLSVGAVENVFYRVFSLVNIKIAGKWMFIPLKMVLIGIDPYPFCSRFVDDKCCTVTIRNTYCREAQFSNLRVTKKHGSLHMTADPVRLDTQMGHVACRTWGTSWNDSKAIRGPAFLAAWFPEIPDKPRYYFEIKRERESERARTESTTGDDTKV